MRTKKQRTKERRSLEIIDIEGTKLCFELQTNLVMELARAGGEEHQPEISN
jgi:hypothetical protein